MSATAGPALHHHPSEALLLAHAVGILGKAHDLVVAAHLSFCPECDSRCAASMEIGGRLLDALPPTPLASGALERAMDKLDVRPPDGGGQDGEPGLATPDAGEMPAVLRDMIRTARLRWLAPGVRQSILLRRFDGTLRLLRVAPGTALPRHGHRGTELTLVLEGAFSDGTGHYRRGDLAEVREGVDHQPAAEGATDCVCLIATRGPLHFKGMFGGLIGRAVR